MILAVLPGDVFGETISFLQETAQPPEQIQFIGLKHCLKSFGNQPKHKYRMFPPLLPFKALCSYYLINLHSRFWKGRWFSSCNGDCKSGSRRRRRRVSCNCPPIGASGRVLLCVDLCLLCLWVDVWGS